MVVSLVLLVLCALSLRIGAVDISYAQIWHWMGYDLWHPTGRSADDLYRRVFYDIRLPRTLLCMIVGAALSVSGCIMQALFRNPIIEPGLVGTSAGAALGAAVVFVIGKEALFDQTGLSHFVLPASAFAGAGIATMAVFIFSSYAGRVSANTMLLAGISVNALATAGTGFLSYISRDPQARSITFWSLGTFSGADWNAVLITGTISGIVILVVLRTASLLDILQLGDAEAKYLGINTHALKRKVILLNTMMVATATSMVGIIAFIGLLVPHVARILGGTRHKYQIIASALIGSAVMTGADTICRVVVAPSEMPIGIISAFAGAPLFLWMLVKENRRRAKAGIYD